MPIYIKTCNICKNEYKSLKLNKKFCSRICYAKYRSQYFRGFKHPNWNEDLHTNKTCLICKKSFNGKKNACSRECADKKKKVDGVHLGSNNGNWKGGRTGGGGQYVFLLKPDYIGSNKYGYCLEHRFLMEQKIGRLLAKNEVVHHINEIKSDNRMENLLLMTKAEHDNLHRLQRIKRGIVLKRRRRSCFVCRKIIYRKSGHNIVCCRKCKLEKKRLYRIKEKQLKLSTALQQ